MHPTEYSEEDIEPYVETRTLQRGWTTGACATGAVVGAIQAFLRQEIVTKATPTLPNHTPTFDVIDVAFDGVGARASIIKDAGDDPDVTHGAKITAYVRKNETGILFKAGTGVGIVTKKGLPIEVGEPAINPKPRQMIIDNLIEQTGHSHWLVEISIENGEEIAKKTWNPRLGIVGGLSVLGTTGVVIPYSCSSWIHSIHRGIDVALADGLTHLVGSTGKTSEKVAMETLKLPEQSYLDMGDFAGGMLKYLAKHPAQKITISGGFAKILKLAQGARDLHSSRSQVNFTKLSEMIRVLGGNESQISMVKSANTALEVLSTLEGIDIQKDLLKAVANSAKTNALSMIGSGVTIDILIVSRTGDILYWDGA